MRGFLYSLFLLLILFNTNFSYSKVISTEEWARNAWGNLEITEVTTKKVSDSLFLLYGLEEILLYPQVLMVSLIDSQQFGYFSKNNENIEKLTDDKIIYTINTHWHWDHADGNLFNKSTRYKNYFPFKCKKKYEKWWNN